MSGNVTFPEFLRQLAVLIGPWWMAGLIVGILFAYAATLVLFVLPDRRFRRWVFIETDFMFCKGGPSPHGTAGQLPGTNALIHPPLRFSFSAAPAALFS